MPNPCESRKRRFPCFFLFMSRLPAIPLILPLIAVSLLSCQKKEGAKTFPGYIEGDFVYISPVFSGKLKELKVEKGQTVKKDALLFALDYTPKEARLKALQAMKKSVESILADMKKGKRQSVLDSLQNQVESAKIFVDGANTGHERTSEMYKKDAISFKEYNIVKHIYMLSKSILKGTEINLRNGSLGSREDRIASVNSALTAVNNMVTEAEWELNQRKQKAPADAYVFDTFFHEGEVVTAGKPVVSLLPPENIKARFYVRETVLDKIRTGNKVSISIDGISEPVPGIINYISPKEEYTPPVIFSKQNRSKLVYLVEASVSPENAKKLHPGQPITVDAGLDKP